MNILSWPTSVGGRVPGLCLLLAACDGASKADDTAATPETLTPACEAPVEVACVDDMVLDLSLQGDRTSEGEVTTETDGEDFVTSVDGSAGGLQDAPNNAWVYIRFTPEGAERVDIDDESALESMDWDLAVKRFVLRLNGGSSGPSCVGAAPQFGVTYAEVASVPEGITWLYDSYYTDDCTFVNDSSGLDGSPQVALGPWWEYPGCVATTLTPFLVQLADGHVVKLVVEAYYGDGQDTCNETGAMGSDSGHFTLRWAYVL